jgi:hypothetical protein
LNFKLDYRVLSGR